MYNKLIREMTGCTEQEALGVEAYMREDHGSLSGIDPATFRREAKSALCDVRAHPSLARDMVQMTGVRA